MQNQKIKMLSAAVMISALKVEHLNKIFKHLEKYQELIPAFW